MAGRRLPDRRRRSSLHVGSGARLAMARLDRSRGRGWLVLRVPGADGIGERGDDLGHPFDGPRAVADGSGGRLHGRRATLGHPRSGRTSRPHRVRRARGPHDSRHSRRSRDAVRARHVARVSGPDDGSIGLNGVGQRACGGLGHPRGCGGPRRHAAVAVSESAAGQVSDPAHAATATLAAAKRQPLPDVCRGLVAGHRGVRRASPVAWARPSPARRQPLRAGRDSAAASGPCARLPARDAARHLDPVCVRRSTSWLRVRNRSQAQPRGGDPPRREPRQRPADDRHVRRRRHRRLELHPCRQLLARLPHRRLRPGGSRHGLRCDAEGHPVAALRGDGSGTGGARPSSPGTRASWARTSAGCRCSTGC